MEIIPTDEPIEELEIIDENPTFEDLMKQPTEAWLLLRKLKQLSPEEEKLQIVEKRKIIKDRLTRFKEELALQKEGIYKAIDEIKTIIETMPDTDRNTFDRFLMSFQDKYRLTNYQFYLFSKSINSYIEKHAAVEKYRAEYPNDSDLFEAVFGVKPVGFIDVIKDPMTLYFRCSSPDDYALAFNYGRATSNENIARAQSSGGGALSSVKIPELKNTITIENVSANSSIRENILVDKKMSLNIGGQFFNLKDSVGEIKIKTSTNKKFEVLVHYLSKYIEVFDVSDAAQPSIVYEGSLHDFSLNLSSTETLHISEEGVGILAHGLTPEDRTEIIYRKFEMSNIPEKKSSEMIQKHEEQHQFNKLFKSAKSINHIDDLARKANAPFKDKKETANYLMHSFAIYFKDTLEIDESAKDEILAYYRSGYTASKILETMSTSELYDWAAIHKKHISTMPDDIAKMLAILPIDPTITTHIDKEKITEHVDNVMGEEYKEHLKLWTGAILVLEDKGFNKDEILSMLYSEPVEKWVALTDHAKVKINNDIT